MRLILIVELSEEEELEIRDFISLLQPIELTYNHEMNTINWGLNKVESFIHRFEIPEPYRSNLLREVDQLRAYPFFEDKVQNAFYLIADILEDYLKYIRRIEIKSNKESRDLMSYLFECFNISEAILRTEGDPQIQQLAQFILGHIHRDTDRRLKIMDVGAGKGDLINAIKISGASSQILYIPIEPNQENWEIITDRCKECENLEFLEPKASIRECSIDFVDIIFFVNVFHELPDIDIRVENLYNAFKLTQKKGQIIIHEVVILPKLESNFFMWDEDDYNLILTKTKADINQICANTLTRVGGLPLQTICLSYNDDNLITEECIKNSIVDSLNEIMDKWFDLLFQEIEKDNSSKKRKRYIAFLMVQHTYAKVWCSKYIPANNKF